MSSKQHFVFFKLFLRCFLVYYYREENLRQEAILVRRSISERHHIVILTHAEEEQSNETQKDCQYEDRYDWHRLLPSQLEVEPLDFALWNDPSEVSLIQFLRPLIVT